MNKLLDLMIVMGIFQLGYLFNSLVRRLAQTPPPPDTKYPLITFICILVSIVSLLVSKSAYHNKK